jgi:hypothetical protein
VLEYYEKATTLPRVEKLSEEFSNLIIMPVITPEFTRNLYKPLVPNPLLTGLYYAASGDVFK